MDIIADIQVAENNHVFAINHDLSIMKDFGSTKSLGITNKNYVRTCIEMTFKQAEEYLHK